MKNKDIVSSYSSSGYTPSVSEVRAETQGSYLEAVNEEPMEGCFYLACLDLLILLNSCTVQGHLLRSGTVHSGLGLPTSTISQKKCPISLPIGQSHGGIFSIEPLFPNDTNLSFGTWMNQHTFLYPNYPA